jgi:hypothetical protein
MSISIIEIELPTIETVQVTGDTLTVDLSDGRSISTPVAWYPRLLHSTAKERSHWRFIGKGHGIHWEDIDEDISVENILTGKSSGESQSSFRKWLETRSSRQKNHSSGRTSSNRVRHDLLTFKVLWSKILTWPENPESISMEPYITLSVVVIKANVFFGMTLIVSGIWRCSKKVRSGLDISYTPMCSWIIKIGVRLASLHY